MYSLQIKKAQSNDQTWVIFDQLRTMEKGSVSTPSINFAGQCELQESNLPSWTYLDNSKHSHNSQHTKLVTF